MYTIQSTNVTVMVKDMNSAVSFYTEGLGLTLKERWGDHYAQVVAPGIVIGLHPSRKPIEKQDSISIGFGIEKITEAEERLKELGVVYNKSDGKSSIILNFTDPDGNPLYFIELKTGSW